MASTDGAQFKKLLKLLAEQYEKDVAVARAQGGTAKMMGAAEPAELPGAVFIDDEVRPLDAEDLEESQSPSPPKYAEAKKAFAAPGEERQQNPWDDNMAVVPVPTAPKLPPAKMQTDILQMENRGSVNMQIAAIQTDMEREKSMAPEPTSGVGGFVRGVIFERTSASLLIANGIFIGVQVSQDHTVEDPLAIQIIDYIFCVCFLIELAVRFVGYGCKVYWLDRNDRYWNWFDFFIVISSTVDTVVSATMDGNGALQGISVLRVIRVVRVIRVLRIIKVLAFFRDLRILIQAIISTVKTASFAFGLIFFVMYLFGVGLTHFAREYMKDQFEQGTPVASTSDVVFFFGGLDKTLLTLFMTIAGGIDWLDGFQPLTEIGGMAPWVFIFYVCLMVLCIMNVLLGIFCQCALDTTASDKENVIQFQLQDRQRFIQTLGELFAEWDDSGDGRCSIAEFKKHLQDDQTQALLSSLEIESRDAMALFEMLDSDDNGHVDLNEFITGCITLRGGAKAVQLEKVTSLNKVLQVRFDSLDYKVDAMQRLFLHGRAATYVHDHC